jgi:hypothetical protein
MEALGCRYGQGYFFAKPMDQVLIDQGAVGLATPARRQRRRRSDGPAASGRREAEVQTPRLAQTDPTPA